MDEKTKKYVDRIESASNSMSNIIKDVLEFSKSSSLQKENVSLDEIFQNMLSEIDIPDRIKIILPKKDFSLKCDKSKLQSVFTNLITNAIQSITDDGKISIFVREESRFFIISFEDSGPGIPKEQISKIFEPLFTTKQKGTGLGLAICKTIIEKHGGTISVKNNPTTFIIKLPKYLEYEI
jgi:signal transduction histidine kinase